MKSKKSDDGDKDDADNEDYKSDEINNTSNREGYNDHIKKTSLENQLIIDSN